MIGSRLGSYEIIEEIGRGGMATVYRAYHPNTERHVAIKIIKASIIDDATARERFQREARLVARLEHPHLLPIHDFDGENDPPYLVMRFLEGGTLKDILSQRPLPFEEIAYLVRQMSSALDYAHRQGIVHRDIKPSNVMIDREGNAFVTDFGIARMTGQAEGGEGITGTGVMIGTPDYMPPEQGQGQTDVDLRADIYSLGVMFFQMLTGKLPFEAPNALGVILKHFNEPVPSAVALNPDLPVAVDAVILKAMAKDPAARYQTVNEFAQAVVEVLGGVVASSPMTLQMGAQESIEMKAERRAGQLDEINTIMKKFADERGDQFTPEGSTPSEQQRQMTALQVDLKDMSEMLYSEFDEEKARDVLDGLWAQCGEIGAARGGTLHSRTGEVGLILWGLESTREDAPEQSIHTGLEIQAMIAELAVGYWGDPVRDELPFRIGVMTGPVLISRDPTTGDTSASGGTMTVVSKVAEAAPPGAVMVGYDTFTLVRGVFNFLAEPAVRIRGREPLEVFRALNARPRAFRLQSRGIEGVETAMIGREPQMQILTDAIDLMVEDRETQVVTVVGDAGVGKSRLLFEFSNYIDLLETTFWFFQARATQQNMIVPYAMTRDLFNFRFEILDSDAPSLVREKFEAGIAKFMGEGTAEQAHYVGQLVGYDFSDIPYVQAALQNPSQFHDQALKYLGDFFLIACQTNPVLIEIEDIHWADDKSLDLVNNLVSNNRKLPFFVICMARPSLYEHRPSWGEGQRFHARIELDPLSELNTRRLIREILKKIEHVPTELRDLIAERAEGNPFYVEELIKTLIDDKVILKGEDEWTVDMSKLATVRVPATLTGVLQARLDSLPVGERSLLQRASVVGRIFWDTSAEFLSASEGVTAGTVQGLLKSLREKEMIFLREETIFEKANEFVFRHAILRDVTYESIAPKQRRAYHALAAAWLTEASGERAGEYAMLIADHFEKAGETGQAAAYLRKAGEPILNTSGPREALPLFERALALPFNEADSAERANLHIQMGRALLNLSQYDEAQTHLQSALDLAGQAGDIGMQAQALNRLGDLVGRRGDLTGLVSYIEQAIPLARQSGDARTLAEVLRDSGGGYWQVGQHEKAIACAEEAMGLFEGLGDRLWMSRSIQVLSLVAMSQGRMQDGERYGRQSLEIAREIGSRPMIAIQLLNLAEAARYQGRLEEARAGHSEALAMYRDLGSMDVVALCLINLAQIDVADNQLDSARRQFKEAGEIAQQVGALPFVMFAVFGIGLVESLSDNADHGLALFGLAYNHPSADVGAKSDFDYWMPTLNEKLGAEAVKAGMEKGKGLDLDTVINEILKG